METVYYILLPFHTSDMLHPKAGNKIGFGGQQNLCFVDGVFLYISLVYNHIFWCDFAFLLLQNQTRQMMYEIIAKELKAMDMMDAHPQDYLNFYCLGKREEIPKELSDSKHTATCGESVIILHNLF